MFGSMREDLLDRVAQEAFAMTIPETAADLEFRTPRVALRTPVAGRVPAR
jgi:hypothetical protein